MSQIKLPYLGSNSYGEINQSPVGYDEVQGIEKYQGSSTRNVRIVRVDMIKYLVDHFSEVSLSKYRDVLYYILSGHGSKKDSSIVLQGLEHIYKEDDVFKVKLGKIVYFRDTNLEHLSVFDSLLIDVKNTIDMIQQQVTSTVPYVKIICTSSLYIYYSVNESISNEDLLSIKGLEVVSR